MYKFTQVVHKFTQVFLSPMARHTTLIVSSIIHRCSEYINCTVTVHDITSTSSAYAVKNTEVIREQKDVYRRYNSNEGNSSNKNNKNKTSLCWS